MHKLFDFRLRMNHKDDNQWIESLNNILCRGHFRRLQTLYCNDGLDISRIIRSRTELQILGIYSNYSYSPEKLLNHLKHLRSAQVSLPMVFLLHPNDSNLYRLGIFPAFYSVERIATIPELAAKSFNDDQGTGIQETVPFVDLLSIYLVDSSDMAAINTLAQNMSVVFPGLNWLNFCFERRCEITSKGLKQLLPFFSSLKGLIFDLWPVDDGKTEPKIPENVKLACVKEWEVLCPDLNVVKFMDGVTLQKRHNETDWVLVLW